MTESSPFGSPFDRFRPIIAGAVFALAAALVWALTSGPLHAQVGSNDAGADKVSMAGALKGKNLVVITLDTVRADHVSCYGNPAAKGLTPNIDSLAAEGTLFLNAYSQTNVTNPSHVSIFTGLYAIDAKIMNNQTSLPRVSPDVDTLPAAFQRADYRTVGFPATPHVSDTTLQLPGFDEPNDLIGGPIAQEMVDRALKWLDRPSDKPFFMWLHFFDPHMKYEPPEEYSRQFYEGDPKEGPSPPLKEDEYFRRSPKVVHEQFSEVRDRSYPSAMYKGEMKYTDTEVRRFINGLKERGLYANTGIVLVADHGESLGDHRIYYDHFGLYEPTLRIPFLAVLPGFPSGVRVTEVVNQIDIVPTVCHLWGVEVKQPHPMHGINLADAMLQRPSPTVGRLRSMVHEDAHNRRVLARRGPWKLIFQIKDPPKYPDDQTMLFNLDEDPQEKNNLAEERPQIVAQLKPMIQRWIDEGKWDIKNRDPDPDQLSPEERKRQAELRERLKSLGYIEDEDEDEEGDVPTTGIPRAGKDLGTRLSVREFGEAAISAEVGLTAEQRTKVRAIIARARREIGAAAKAGKQDKTRVAIRQKMRDDIRGLLNPKQRAALKKAVSKAVAEKEGEKD